MRQVIQSVVVGVISGSATLATASSWVGNYDYWSNAAKWTNPANVPDTADEIAIFGSNGGPCVIGASYTIGALVLSPGNLQYTSGASLTTATFGWYAGSISGTAGGTTTVTGDSFIGVDSNLALQLFGGVLNLNGDTDLYNVRNNGFGIYAQNDAVIYNRGTFSISDDTSVYEDGNTHYTFNNLATLRKTAGTGESQVTSLNNNGDVNAASGTLSVSMKSGGSSNGSFGATSGHTLNIRGSGTHTLATGLIYGVGTINLASGTLNSTGSLSGVTSVASDLNLTGATLTGKYTLSALDWSAGTIGGTPATNVSITTANLTGNTAAYRTVTNATLNLTGATQLGGNTGYGLLITGNSTVNNSGGMNITSDAGIYVGPGTNTFNNTGSIAKTGGTGNTQVYGLVNAGTVSVQSGAMTVHLKNASTTDSIFITSSGTFMDMATNAADHTFGNDVEVDGAGTFRFNQKLFYLTGIVRANGLTLQVGDITGNSAADVVVLGRVLNSGNNLVASITKTGAGTLYLSGQNVYAGGTKIAGGTLTATKSAYDCFLTNTGGVDLANTSAKLVLQYLTTANNPEQQIKALLAQSAANNYATGQIRTSINQPGYAIGYTDNGIALTLALTVPGDANLDGVTNFNDFLVLQNNFNTRITGWNQGNFNYDNFTDFNDFLILQNYFGRTADGGAVPVSAGERAALSAFAASVPEPSALAGFAMASALGARRLRRQN